MIKKIFQYFHLHHRRRQRGIVVQQSHLKQPIKSHQKNMERKVKLQQSQTAATSNGAAV